MIKLLLFDVDDRDLNHENRLSVLFSKPNVDTKGSKPFEFVCQQSLVAPAVAGLFLSSSVHME